MKRIIIKLLSAFFQWGDALLCKMHITRPKVIIWLDGGICSQMLMYLNGRLYEDYPIEIYYDARWYTYCGKDMNGNFDRLFELTTLFPKLPYQEMSSWKCHFYQMFFKYPNEGVLPRPETIKHSYWLGYYLELPENDLNRLYERHFRGHQNKDGDKHIIKEKNGTACAVHVRRGDLANYEDQWYKKIPSTYFFNAIEYVRKKYENVHLYFFCEEQEWVEENLCPALPTDARYTLIRGNKAYEDLLLISECDVVIASQGSFGKYGAKLNGASELIMYKGTAVNQQNLLYVTYIE